MANDGINDEWNKRGEDSPVKKYAKAFKVDYHRMKKEVSIISGVRSQRFKSLPCFADIGCPSRMACGKRRGHPVGNCIPLWFGICHAWAPASIRTSFF